MKLTVKDAAEMLGVSEKTVYRWIRSGSLPAYQISEQYRFNRAELLEWATAKRINVSPRIFEETEGGETPLPSVAEALSRGGIHYRVSGKSKEESLAAVVEILPLPREVDRGFLLSVLLARENLGSTGIGDGIAIPHVRNPIVLHVEQPMVALCYLEEAIDFGALDGLPVRILFTLITPTVRTHLHILSRLAFLLRAPRFRELVLAESSRDAIFAAAREVEAAIPSREPDAVETAG